MRQHHQETRPHDPAAEEDYVRLDDFLTGPTQLAEPVLSGAGRPPAGTTEKPAASSRGADRQALQGAPTGSAGAARAAEPAAAPSPGPGAAPPARPVETAEALTPERLLRKRSQVPEGGWRLALYRATFGLVNFGDSSDVLERQQLETRVAARLTGSTRSVAVLTRKGGVGKTTTATLLGKTLASLRHDRTVAIDANPDAGTLILRTERQTPATVWDVVDSRDAVSSFADMSRLVSRDTTRLDVIASESDPHLARAFGATQYRQVADLLSRYYSISVTDTGTDFTHEVLAAVLARADCIVVVAGTKVDEARAASETIDMVEAFGYPDLARNAIVALVESTGSQIDVAEVHRHFESKSATVVRVPWDRHIAEGSVIALSRLHRSTRRAGLTLAAAVADQIKDSNRTV